MTEKANILHILDHSLPLHSGYTFRTRAIMKSQQRSGWNVAGLTGVRQYQHGELPDKAYEDAQGLRFYRTLSKADGPPLLREWREVNRLTDAVIDLYAEYPFDILHAHSPALNGLAAARAARQLGVPLVYEIRAFWEDAAVGNGTGSEGSAKYWLTRALENHVIGRADAVAVICEGLCQDLMKRGVPASKVIISPNGVDMDLFGTPTPYNTPLARKIGVNGKDVIGYIGSFYDYEGLDDLISMMEHLGDAANDAHLLMVGGGPMEDALRLQAQQSPAANRIHFVGRVPHEEVEDYYSLVDILAYPRKSQRLTDIVTPLKPLEAMAQGRLVAASDVGGHRELIEDGITGTLFSADDPKGAAKTITELLSSRDMWDERRAAAKKYVEENRNWDKNIKRYDPVYHLLLEQAGIRKAV